MLPIKELDELKSTYEWEQFERHIRFNEQLDVYINKKTGRISIFNLVEKQWFYCFHPDKMMDYVVNVLEFYGERPALINDKKRFTMDDKSEMPFGKHKGEKMANVPADYLIWLYENAKCFGAVKEYIKENLPNLMQEVAQQKKIKR